MENCRSLGSSFCSKKTRECRNEHKVHHPTCSTEGQEFQFFSPGMPFPLCADWQAVTRDRGCGSVTAQFPHGSATVARVSSFQLAVQCVGQWGMVLRPTVAGRWGGDLVPCP